MNNIKEKNELYSIGIIWNKGIKYAIEIIEQISKIVEVQQVKKYNLKNSYEEFVLDCYHDDEEAFLKHYNIEKYFKDYECSGNTGKEKTHNIKKVLERNSINDAIYVGDTEKDYQAATTNNLKFIWARYGFGKCKNYEIYIDDIIDILKYKNI